MKIYKFSPSSLRLHLFFKRYLSPNAKLRFLEIGCAPDRWLVYFRKNFGFDVYGVDYSREGVLMTRKNLRNNVCEGTVFWKDVLDNDFRKNFGEYFDIVFSHGVIEHYVDPGDIIGAHLDLPRKDGLLIITVPNLRTGSIYHGLLDRDCLERHNIRIMELVNFRKLLQSLNRVDIKFLNYLGPITLTLSPRLANILRPIGFFIGYLTFPIGSSRLSPFLILVATKR
jgi:SAM-dependent methyltransferase